MEEKLTVGIFNDSFPPTIDGVANAAFNYASAIDHGLGHAVVATPWYPDVTDDYTFPVVRYPSIYISKQVGYRAGMPFDPVVVGSLVRENLDIIHIHAPFVSALLARMVRHYTGAPIVFTYHTKFNIDIEKRVSSDALRKLTTRFILANIEACDEVWVVSEGAGENLRSLGYMGPYRLMENGTDFPKGRASAQAIAQLDETYALQPDETVFLFVGRMMWYKGVRLSIDGLREAKARGGKFRMFFVGDGNDRPEIEEYVRQCGLAENCVFTGAIRDRELLRAFFSRADLFLFPSTYDTNGIVVREAAACGCASLLIRGSCAAEGIRNGDTGIIINESVQEMAAALTAACADRERLTLLGENAAEKLYLSWEDAVGRAYQRYQAILASSSRKEDDLPLFLSQFSKLEQVYKSSYQQSLQQTKYRLLRSERRMRHTLRGTEEHFANLLLRLLGDEDPSGENEPEDSHSDHSDHSAQ